MDRQENIMTRQRQSDIGESRKGLGKGRPRYPVDFESLYRKWNNQRYKDGSRILTESLDNEWKPPRVRFSVPKRDDEPTEQ
jgi:hypothetical protein